MKYKREKVLLNALKTVMILSLSAFVCSCAFTLFWYIQAFTAQQSTNSIHAAFNQAYEQMVANAQTAATQWLYVDAGLLILSILFIIFVVRQSRRI